jgi:hypothetical protein
MMTFAWRHLSHHILSPGRDSNLEPPERKAEVLSNELRRSLEARLVLLHWKPIHYSDVQRRIKHHASLFPRRCLVHIRSLHILHPIEERGCVIVGL